MTTKIADDTASIAQRLKEIEAEKLQAIMGKPLEEPKEEPKADDDVYGMYAGQVYSGWVWSQPKLGWVKVVGVDYAG